MSILRKPRSPFGVLYDEAGLPNDIRRSLRMIIAGNICGNMWNAICAGSPLAGYATALGSGDFAYGVLMAMPFLGTLMQIPASFLVSRTGKRRLYMLTFGIFARVLWIVIGLVPFIVPMSHSALRFWIVIFLAGLSAASGSFINVSFMPWLADLLPISIRGRWLSDRDKLTSVAGVATGLASAALLDNIPGLYGYMLVFVAGGLLGVMDMLCFIKVRKVERVQSAHTNALSILKGFFADKPFVQMMLFWTVWNFSVGTSSSYFTRYALTEVGMSFIAVTLIVQILPALVNVLVISKWGRLLDRYGCKPVMLINCIGTSIGPLLCLLSSPGNITGVLLFNLLSSAFWGAGNVCSTNMIMSYSPDAHRPTYIAIFSCCTSLLGSFLGTLAGGGMLEGISRVLASMGAVAYGVSRFHVMFVISVVIRLLVSLIFVPRLTNDRDGSVREMLRDAAAALRAKRRRGA